MSNPLMPPSTPTSKKFLAIPTGVAGNPNAREIVSAFIVADGPDKGHVEIALDPGALEGVEMWGVLLVDVLDAFARTTAKYYGFDLMEVHKEIAKRFVEELNIRVSGAGGVN